MIGCLLLAGVLGLPQGDAMPLKTIVVTKSITLEKNATLHARLVIKANNVKIDGNGATLVGPGEKGDLKTFTGVGVASDGNSGVVIANLKAHGFQSGLVAQNGARWTIEHCDFSDNYHDPDFGWGNGERVGGIILTHLSHARIQHNRANRVWNGLDLDNCNDNLVIGNDFSHCSNVCLKMQTSSRNDIMENNLSYGIRIKPGETHARDSTSVLIESGSNNNRFSHNDATHGGDGIFIRVLNNWVSTGNIFTENDCSYANNNCFEAWSPGNTYLRNRANHGSYGFWLGASDQTILIGNEAAYNGLPTGNHNAPEPDFAHGGIVFVNGPSSHTLVMDNYCHHNGGGGIVLRGDRATKGKAWKAFHWIIQKNKLENNRWGIFARYADWIHIADNMEADNAEPDVLDEVTNLTYVTPGHSPRPQPKAKLAAPHIAVVGQPVTFDATGSRVEDGKPLTYRWDYGDGSTTVARFTHLFMKPGFYRVGLTVTAGTSADLAYRDLIVVEPLRIEYGTEGSAAQWSYEIENNTNGKAKLVCANDPNALIGKTCLRFTPKPYPGDLVTALYPATKDARWNLSGKTKLVFWIRAQNPNTENFQNAGPILRFYGAKGEIILTPTNDRNLLNDPGYSEGRWTWVRREIPLAGDEHWKRETKGDVDLNQINALSFSCDSYGYEPFTLWLDGLHFE